MHVMFLTLQDEVNMYVHLKIGPLTWEIWQKVYFSILLLLLSFLFFSLNPSISKTIRSIGPNGLMCSDLSKCLLTITMHS